MGKLKEWLKDGLLYKLGVYVVKSTKKAYLILFGLYDKKDQK